MNTEHCYCIIMAGGSGTRFWPASRTKTPKQFMPSTELGGKSQMRDTYERFREVLPKDHIYVITVNTYRDIIREQIPELPEENLLLEPYGRDTAPCITYATCKILKKDPDATTIVSPADHLILDRHEFCSTLNKAAEYASEHEVLMTLGLFPTSADTNFGYIQAKGGSISRESSEPIKIKTFTEKPDHALAEVFIQSGEFLWNAGIFVWKGKVILEEMAKYLPETMALFKGWEYALDTPEESQFIETAYSSCEKMSVAYGILEKTDRAWVYPSHFNWNDIGSWESFYNYKKDQQDNNGNVSLRCKCLSENCKDNLILSHNSEKLIAIRGLENYLVVDTDDALLICPRDDKRFKDLISHLALPGYEKYR